jgi:hypothetical protein
MSAWKREQPCRCALAVCFTGLFQTADTEIGLADRCDMLACTACFGSGDRERCIDITKFVPDAIMKRYAALIAEDDMGWLGDGLQRDEESGDFQTCLS